MAGFLRFLALFVALVAILVLIILPLAATPILTQMVRDMGLRSDSLHVSVALFDPTLVLGRSRRLHISATNVDLSRAAIGTLELTFGDVSLFDRSWRTVDGDITNMVLTSGNETIGIGSVRVVGSAVAANATIRLTAAESEALIRFAAEREGLTLDRVKVGNDGVRVTVGGVEALARLEVRGGALVLFPGTGGGGVPLLQAAPSDAWQLEDAWIADAGLNVHGIVDTTRLAEQVTS